jgi:hypothetical protein
MKTPSVILPDGKAFKYWENETSFAKTYYVDQKHPKASDANPGTAELPFLTIRQAAEVLQPGQHVLIGEGVYREFVRPLRGGAGPDKMIGYEAAAGAKVVISGTEVWTGPWTASSGLARGDQPDAQARVWHGELPRKAFDGTNPFAMVNMPSTPWGGYVNILHRLPKEAPDRAYQMRRGLLFVEGQPLEQVVFYRELWRKPGTYWVEDDGLNLHFRLPGDEAPTSHTIEFTAREQVFSPAVKHLGYIHVKGLRFERVGNGFPGEQRGALSTNCGHHWLIEGNEIHWANAVGMDIGNQSSHHWGEQQAGFHIVRRNTVTDCGITGICGVVVKWKLHDTVIEDNRLERNCWHDAELLWENAAIKIHLAVDCLIRHNLIRDTGYGAGIWVDFNNANTRVCHNVIINIRTEHGAIFFEASQKPNLVDENVIWGVATAGIPDNAGGGHGVYEHDCDYLIVQNNFVNKVDGAAVCLNLGALDRMVNGRGSTGRRCRVLGNILTDSGHAIIVPTPDNFADRNLLGTFRKPAPLRIQNPAELLNLEAWRDFHGWDVNGREVEVEAELDPAATTLRLKVKDGRRVHERSFDLSGDFSLGAFLDEILR